MALDAVIVNYKTPELLRACLDSFEQHPATALASLTVVDVQADGNGQTDPRARWISLEDNVGYARACNHGARGGHGDIIALFNADIQLTDNALDACHDALAAHDDWAVLGPRQIDSSGRIRHAGIFGTNTQPAHRGWGQFAAGQYVDVREAITVSGSAYFVKRDVWNQLTNCDRYRDLAPDAEGAFLPTPHYYEETFCSYHARAHGQKVIYYGPVTIIHEWHQSSPIGGWAEQQLAVSKAYFRAACQHHKIACD